MFSLSQAHVLVTKKWIHRKQVLSKAKVQVTNHFIHCFVTFPLILCLCHKVTKPPETGLRCVRLIYTRRYIPMEKQNKTRTNNVTRLFSVPTYLRFNWTWQKYISCRYLQARTDPLKKWDPWKKSAYTTDVFWDSSSAKYPKFSRLALLAGFLSVFSSVLSMARYGKFPWLASLAGEGQWVGEWGWCAPPEMFFGSVPGGRSPPPFKFFWIRPCLQVEFIGEVLKVTYLLGEKNLTGMHENVVFYAFQNDTILCPRLGAEWIAAHGCP